MKTNPLRIAAAVFLAAVGVSILIFIALANNASQWNFISYWAAGQKLAHGANPYDRDAELRIVFRVGFDRVEPHIMCDQPLAFLLAQPLGFFGSNMGLVFWFIFLLFSLVESIHMMWVLHGRLDNRLHLLGCCFAPVMGCLMLYQFGLSPFWRRFVSFLPQITPFSRRGGASAPRDESAPVPALWRCAGRLGSQQQGVPHPGLSLRGAACPVVRLLSALIASGGRNTR